MVYFTTRVCTTMSDFMNIADNKGDTPLIRAVRDRKVDMVKVCLYAGANVWHRNKAGETAWSLARGHEEIWALVGAGLLVDCIFNNVAPPAASREPSPEPSLSPPPQPSASPEPSPEGSPEPSPEGSPVPPAKRQRLVTSVSPQPSP